MSPAPPDNPFITEIQALTKKKPFMIMSMYKKLIGSLTISLLFLLSATPSFAQQNDVKVTGKITDGSGAPLAGVVVVVKDGKSNNGAVSNTQGVYEIKVPASSTLLFTCLGYTDQEVKLGASNVVNVTMTEDAQSLDEVVVVGYGTQKKKDLTGGLAVVSKQTLEMVSTNNLMDRLVGQVAGLNITTGNEAPGSNQTLLIRGQNSLTASNDPLIILDGIPYSGGLADLDPNIIENMSVLKDASAVAIYGSRGSNGVILIQTKRGSQGEFHVTYKTKLAIAEPMQRIETMGPNEFIRLKQDMGRLKNNYSGEQLDPLVGSIISASEKVNYAKGITNDWQDYVFRTVFTMDHQLSFQGGNEKTTYMASVSYLDNPGVVYNSNYQRTNVYASINQKMNDWLSVGLTTQFVNRETGGATPNLEHAIKQSPYGIYKDETGAYYEEPMDYSNLPNPMKDVNADQKRTGRNFMANGFLDLKLLRNMKKCIYTRLKLYECSKVCHSGNLTLHDSTNIVLTVCIQPRILILELQAQCNLVILDILDEYLCHITNLEYLARILNTSPRHLRDMKKTVCTT